MCYSILNMNTIMTDTVNDTITSLPSQLLVEVYLDNVFGKSPTEKFHLTHLTKIVKDFFEVTDEDAALKCSYAHGATGTSTTRLEQLVHWGCMHLLVKRTIKRTGPNEYQHISGPDAAYRTAKEQHLLLAEAIAFYRRARNLGFTLEESRTMWAGRWDEETTRQAEFATFA